MSLLFLTAALLFSIKAILTLWHLRFCHRLPSFKSPAPGRNPDRPVCSIVIAARNEGARLEQTIRRMLSQEGVLELILVNDRSTDQSAQILDRLSREDSRLAALEVRELPPGWLGKCHACHVGASRAQGEWILFSDADCWLTPDALSRALQVAAETGVDHVTLTPGVRPLNSAAAAWHLVFLISMSDWISRVNREVPGSFIGVGAFNLVRRKAYQACGGYEALRMTVVDDGKLGVLLSRAGKKSRAFIGGDDTQCHWGETVGQMLHLMEKNFFAAIDYKTAVLVGFLIFGFGLWGVAMAGAFAGSWQGWVAVAGLWSLVVPSAIFCRRLGWNLSGALMVPLILPVLFLAVGRSGFRTLSRRGILWRETFYSLEELRAGNVPWSAGKPRGKRL